MTDLKALAARCVDLDEDAWEVDVGQAALRFIEELRTEFNRITGAN